VLYFCADIYDKARKLAQRAEETSNLESGDDADAKRKRKEPAAYSDVEDGDGML